MADDGRQLMGKIQVEIDVCRLGCKNEVCVKRSSCEEIDLK